MGLSKLSVSTAGPGALVVSLSVDPLVQSCLSCHVKDSTYCPYSKGTGNRQFEPSHFPVQKRRAKSSTLSAYDRFCPFLLGFTQTF